MRANVRRTALWAVVLAVGAVFGVLWAADRGSGGGEITAAGFARGDASETSGRPDAAHVAVQQVAQPRQGMLTVTGGAGDWDSFGAGSSALQGAAEEHVADGDPAGGASDAAAGEDTVAVMVAGRASAVSGCGERFVSPGEALRFGASGFADGSSVLFTGLWASFGGGESQALVVAGVTADADGALGLSWTVPTAPDAATDAAPRAYAIQASGENPDGGTHTAMMIEPLVSYPATVLCAAGDTASTALGTAAQIAVLANDTAPTGGTLDGSTVKVRPAPGGTFTVEGTTGAVTFTPDPGFWGDVQTTYAVYDGWGIGVEADLVVTVDAGCTITGTPGVTEITGTRGDDVICVPDRDDWSAFFVIDGRGGDDVILGGAGVEWAYGGNGADTIHGGGGDDRIGGGPGIDTIHGGSGIDTVYAKDLDDTVVDDADGFEMELEPTVTPPAGGPHPYDDWVWVAASQTVAVDVLGNDHDPDEDLDRATLAVTAAPSSGAAVVAENADGDVVVEFTADSVGGSDSFSYEVCDSLGACAAAHVTVMVGTTGCTIIGTDADDTLRGSHGDDVICGLGGGDTIRGLSGNDIIIGGSGDDDINAGDGTDIVWGGNGADTLDGGPGDDTVWGAGGDDTLLASSGTDRLAGGPGADTVTGGSGDDLIWGGPGDDSLAGHAGHDTLWGGSGTDAIRGGGGGDTLWGGPGADTLTGGTGADSLHGGTGDDALDGNTQDDNLWGGPGADTLDGQGHDDELHGGSGEDTLRGGAGDDGLWGGIGADTLDGGNGTDHLDGGPDTDACQRADTTSGCE